MKSTLTQKIYTKLRKHHLNTFKIFVCFIIAVMWPYAVYYAALSEDQVDVMSDFEQVWRNFVVYSAVFSLIYIIVRATKRGFK